MVNLCKIVVAEKPQDLPILQRLPIKFGRLNASYTNTDLLNNAVGRILLYHLGKNLKVNLINPKDIPNRIIERSPSFLYSMPLHITNYVNMNLHAMELYTPPFFLMHRMSTAEAEDANLFTVTIFHSLQDYQVVLYEPELSQDIDICRFA